MQEDVVGTLKTIGHNVRTCSLCGAPYPAAQIASIEADPTDGVISEREEVCPECGRALTEGDNPAVPEDDSGRGAQPGAGFTP